PRFSGCAETPCACQIVEIRSPAGWPLFLAPSGSKPQFLAMVAAGARGGGGHPPGWAAFGPDPAQPKHAASVCENAASAKVASGAATSGERGATAESYRRPEAVSL